MDPFGNKYAPGLVRSHAAILEELRTRLEIMNERRAEDAAREKETSTTQMRCR